MEPEKVSHDEEWLNQFAAMFVPGGHAPMVDLLSEDAFISDACNEDFGALLKFFPDAGKSTCLHLSLACRTRSSPKC